MKGGLKMTLYNQKVVISGNLYQVYNYAKPIYKNYTQKHDKPRGESGLKSSKSLYRLRNNVALTIETNLTQYTKFITLTTSKPIYDLEQFQLMFNAFKLRFKRKYKVDLKYIGVVERQMKRMQKYNLPQAPLHYHLIVFMDLFIPFKVLKELWGDADDSVDIKRVKNTEVSRYLMKYITKEEHLCAFNKKGILKSRNLKEPISIHCLTDNNDLYVYDDLKLKFQTTYLIVPYDLNNNQITDKINQCTLREYRL